MRRRWLRLEPGAKENARAASMAAAVAVGVGALVFYLARILFSREEIRPLGTRSRTPPSEEEE